MEPPQPTSHRNLNLRTHFSHKMSDVAYLAVVISSSSPVPLLVYASTQRATRPKNPLQLAFPPFGKQYAGQYTGEHWEQLDRTGQFVGITLVKATILSSCHPHQPVLLLYPLRLCHLPAASSPCISLGHRWTRQPADPRTFVNFKEKSIRKTLCF
jgi:hypothetical protein